MWPRAKSRLHPYYSLYKYKSTNTDAASEEQEIVAPSKIVITPVLLASVDDESREDPTDAPATGKEGIKAF